MEKEWIRLEKLDQNDFRRRIEGYIHEIRGTEYSKRRELILLSYIKIENLIEICLIVIFNNYLSYLNVENKKSKEDIFRTKLATSKIRGLFPDAISGCSMSKKLCLLENYIDPKDFKKIKKTIYSIKELRNKAAHDQFFEYFMLYGNVDAKEFDIKYFNKIKQDLLDLLNIILNLSIDIYGGCDKEFLTNMFLRTR